MFKQFQHLTAILVLGFALCGGGVAVAADGGYWQDASPVAASRDDGALLPVRALSLDWAVLQADIDMQAGQGLSLSVPRPDQGFDTFMLSDSGTMATGLAARYPEIRSYSGVDEKGNHVRVDISPLGFHAMVYSPDGIWLVQPVSNGMGPDYQVFWRKDVPGQSDRSCDVQHVPGQTGLIPAEVQAHPITTGQYHRDYRAAIVANHQWVQAYTGLSNPTVAQGLAGVVRAINRVNEVYSRDFAIHMTLVDDNDQLIFPSATGDPFGDSSSNNGDALNQYTSRISSIIGSANYDIGHVFTTGSGGVAYLGVVCNNNAKGGGTTGLTNGALLGTDVFYIDYVSHEMGHQFGANHTFNGTLINCGYGNRNSGTAYEPGSASTIMGYAGICGPDNNLQDHSDPYFHAVSMDEINRYTNNSTGSTCGTQEANHLAPTVEPPADYTIPANTPFALAGWATSDDSRYWLSYTWEQYDLGAANNNLAIDPGYGPIIRSAPPSPERVRYVPRLSDLFAGTSWLGEILPTTSRTLTFIETVRDNYPGRGTAQSARKVLTVTANAGPFEVLEPTSTTVWEYDNGTGTGLVTWDVAGTDQSPVSCAAVDIDLTQTDDFASTIELASGVPNSGSAMVDVPNLWSTTARVRVACADNIFFNISPGTFTVEGLGDVIFVDGFDL